MKSNFDVNFPHCLNINPIRSLCLIRRIHGMSSRKRQLFQQATTIETMVIERAAKTYWFDKAVLIQQTTVI